MSWSKKKKARTAKTYSPQKGEGRGENWWWVEDPCGSSKRDRKETDLDRGHIVVPIRSLVVHRRGFQVAPDCGHGLGSAGYDFRVPAVGSRDLPSRTSANCGELQRTSPEPLRNSRISSNPNETRWMQTWRKWGYLNASQRTFEILKEPSRTWD